MSHWKPVDDILVAANVVQDFANKIGGDERIKRFQSGELVLVERSAVATPASLISQQGLANGGVTYASVLNVEEFLDDWSKFLRDVFKVGLPSRKKIVLPKTRLGFGWGVLTPKGMAIERALASYADVCPIWRWTNDNLDKIVESVRSTDSTRVVWFRDRVETDEEHRDKSYNDLWSAGINGSTLLERLLLGRWFHYRVGQHLDVVNITRCDGSRYSDGFVPSVYWCRHYGKVCMDRYSADDRRVSLRSREAVP